MENNINIYIYNIKFQIKFNNIYTTLNIQCPSNKLPIKKPIQTVRMDIYLVSNKLPSLVYDNSVSLEFFFFFFFLSPPLIE